jgi:hypothetical protein
MERAVDSSRAALPSLNREEQQRGETEGQSED